MSFLTNTFEILHMWLVAAILYSADIGHPHQLWKVLLDSATQDA